MSNLDGIFAAGDIVRGASLVVWAIRDGRDAADSIDALHQGQVRRRSRRGGGIGAHNVDGLQAGTSCYAGIALQRSAIATPQQNNSARRQTLPRSQKAIELLQASGARSRRVEQLIPRVITRQIGRPCRADNPERGDACQRD